MCPLTLGVLISELASDRVAIINLVKIGEKSEGFTELGDRIVLWATVAT
jgi:hypothetical protein